MSPNDEDGMAISVDPDQTAVWSGSALFAQAYLSEKLGSLQYYGSIKFSGQFNLANIFASRILQKLTR